MAGSGASCTACPGGCRPRPCTLTELATAARQLTKPGQTWGLGLAGAPGGDGAETFLSLLAACGGRPVDDSGKLTLTTPEAVRALQWWVDLAASGATPPEAISWTREDLQAAFASGRVAMVPGAPELAATLKQIRNCPPFTVTALPADKATANLISCDLVVALASTRHPRECASFLGFVAGESAQRALWMMGGLPTCQAQVAEARQYANLAPYLEQLETARGWPTTQGAAALRVIDQALWLALSGRAAPAAALQSAVEEEAAASSK